jgi:aminoglycoside 6'-N-acetyltransferase
MFIKNDKIIIRHMQDEMHDYQLMAKWLTDDIILEFYGGRDNPFPIKRII